MRSSLIGLWLLAAIFMISHETLANMPMPESPPDYYLAGINKIVVRASETAGNPESTVLLFSQKEKLHLPDLSEICSLIKNDLSASLTDDFKKKVSIEIYKHNTFLHLPIDGAPREIRDPDDLDDENTLLINFQFSLRPVKSADQTLVLGAVYMTMMRLPPEKLRSDRTSGFPRNITEYESAVPFIVEGDKETVKKSFEDAAQTAIKSVAPWLNHMPLDKPAAQ